jgi:hypothetical protein
VTIRRRARDFRGTYGARGARLVLDDDVLLDLPGDEIAEGAREQIGLPACRVAADHTDLPRRPGALRRGPAREEWHRGGCRAAGDEVTAIESR